MTQALIFVVSTLTQLYLLILLLRFWLPWLRADFRNPIAQGVLRVTSPLVVPVRRLVPPLGRLDTATVLVAFAIQFLLWVLISLLLGQPPRVLSLALMTLLELVLLSLRLFTIVIFVSVILSWFAAGSYNPAIGFVNSLAEPLLRPFRRLIPSLGGLDISPVFAIVLLMGVSIWLESLQPYLLR